MLCINYVTGNWSIVIRLSKSFIAALTHNIVFKANLDLFGYGSNIRDLTRVYRNIPECNRFFHIVLFFGLANNKTLL